MDRTEYNINYIVSKIKNSQNINEAVVNLNMAYCTVINYYCNLITSPHSKQLLLYKGDVEPRYWNCVNISDSIKEKILWMSINPSGAKKDKSGNYVQVEKTTTTPIFNDKWDTTGKVNYWRTIISNIGVDYLPFCGHLDIIPIHLSKEKEVWNTFFKNTSSYEFHLVVDLIRCTQELLEQIKPKLIVYSNITTSWLWGMNNGGWMGYKVEPIEEWLHINKSDLQYIHALRSSINGYWQSHPNKGLFRITGIVDSISQKNKTNLEGSFILLDYQVANFHWTEHALHPGDLIQVWKTISSFEKR